MKNKKFAKGAAGTLLTLLMMLSGCETKDQKLVREFAEWMAKKAEAEAQSKFNRNYVYDASDETWLLKAKHDSIKYRDALTRDADIVLEYVGKCHSANEVWNEIQNAPVAREYGPGSFINENGEWEYGDHVDKGYDKAFKIKVNYREYEGAMENLMRLRNAKAKSKFK